MAVETAKPSIPRRVWDAVVHYYHGFRLLALDSRVAVRLLWKTMKGSSLTRREQKQVSCSLLLFPSLLPPPLPFSLFSFLLTKQEQVRLNIFFFMLLHKN